MVLKKIAYAVSLDSFEGVVLTRLGYLENKMDKHK
jgi:hypothetical protein